MKINFFYFFAILSVLVLSCSESEITSTSEFDTDDFELELSSFLTEFELIDINPEALYKSVMQQSSDIKTLSLAEGKFNFEVRETDLELNNSYFEFSDTGELIELQAEGSKTLYLDNLDFENVSSNNVGVVLRDTDLYIEYSSQGEDYVIAPVSDIVKTTNTQAYIHYPKHAILKSTEQGSECLFLDHDTDEIQSDIAEPRMLQYNATITVVIDYSMYQYLGWTGSINYVNDAMYWTNFRYNANSGLPIAIIKGGGYVLNQSGQYGLAYSSDPATYLNNFAAWLNRYNIGNDAEILFTRDHAHWGAAYPNTMCGYNATALVEYHSWTTRRYNIIAHELGHILGAGHTNSGVMRTVANGDSYFTQYSKNQILSFLSSTNWCL